MEFYRGARVIRARSGANIFSSAGDLTMRNTRRYGGYVVHFGMVLIFIGIAGTAFNQDEQKEMPIGASHADRPVHAAAARISTPSRKTTTPPSA